MHISFFSVHQLNGNAVEYSLRIMFLHMSTQNHMVHWSKLTWQETEATPTLRRSHKPRPHTNITQATPTPRRSQNPRPLHKNHTSHAHSTQITQATPTPRRSHKPRPEWINWKCLYHLKIGRSFIKPFKSQNKCVKQADRHFPQKNLCTTRSGHPM